MFEQRLRAVRALAHFLSLGYFSGFCEGTDIGDNHNCLAASAQKSTASASLRMQGTFHGACKQQDFKYILRNACWHTRASSMSMKFSCFLLPGVASTPPFRFLHSHITLVVVNWTELLLHLIPSTSWFEKREVDREAGRERRHSTPLRSASSTPD
ncbi:hypothetical protein FN846DRAFT_258742 [Sphaerosporella brunnea]|uniref:Secreted protein n=1 Tax=Sphaerosporella brunnea TaxID=1250544 RepID=A0A5J5F747_9PEZI|nr:hypothetical protein FN846DRAFT_258742 [Sphaerosporella brunnea]